jgi:tetratricopeptide (TPR) repeat protein
MSRVAGPFLLVLLFSATPEAGQKGRDEQPLRPIAPLDLGRVLDRYADGHFDEAVRTVVRAGDEVGRNLRRHWAVTGRQWIDADPERRPQRTLAAVSLALETEYLRAERGDWRVSEDKPPCPASCVLDWAQLQLAARGEPDGAERAWYLAAAALAGGVRDWRYLHRWVDPARRTRLTPGLMDRALERLPNDRQLQLEQALAAAGRFNVTVEGGGPVAQIGLPAGRAEFFLSLMRPTGPDAAGMLAALVDDPTVGAEAGVRLGYLHWALGQHDAADAALAKASARAQDEDLRYLAQFLRGWFAAARGDAARAIPHLEAALATRPGSQSAAVVLAALELQRGDAGKAHDMSHASLDQRRADADPWRLFLYGHHPQWPARLAALRREVKP